ncbi:MFS transporter [Oceanibacterium hippocampi]|uniref:MFS transporter n=1 Tax=Oceanibacterium hippocampi TaxID=745714 RepID=UPI001592CCD1|nr:MFS transporter [Oceanibacterium hippocampi]
MNANARVIFALFMIHVVCSSAPLGIPALIPFIQSDLGLSLTELGGLSASLSLGVAAAGLFTGWSGDIFGIRVMAGIGLSLAGIAFFIASQSTTIPALVVLFALAGAGYSTITPATNKIVLQRVEKRLWGTAMGIKQTGASVSGFLTALLFPIIGVHFGWSTALAGAGAAIMICGITVFIVHRDPPAGDRQASRGNQRSLRRLLTNRDLVLLCVETALRVGIQFAVLTYLLLFSLDELKLSVPAGAAILAVCQIAGAVGRIFWGVVSDYCFGGRRKVVYVPLAFAASAILLLLSFCDAATPLPLLFLVAAGIGVSALGFQGLGFSLTVAVVPQENVGAASGLSMAFAFSGAVVMTPMFGYIVEHTHLFERAWQALALVAMASACIVLFVREPVAEKAPAAAE